nr:uncharacterized protein LOC109781799 [Aegilops tauschii subsp. strangulata]
MPSVALFCHFFYLRINGNQCSGCACFITDNGSNAISRARKKVEDFRNKWVFMDAKCSYPRLELPTGLPIPREGWSHKKLTDPRAEQFLERMVADLKADDPKAERLTGAMIVKETRVAPRTPISHCTTAPTGRRLPTPCPFSSGLIPLEPSRPPGSPVTVSFGEFSEEEKVDSEVTWEDAGDTSPPGQTDLLHVLSDDDDASEHPFRESPRSAGITTRSRGTPPKKLKLGVPKKGKSALLSRGDASASSSADAAANPGAAPSPAPEACATAPMTMKPAGIALLKRTRDYVAVHQPMPVAKKKREEARTTVAKQLATDAPHPAQKDEEKAIPAARPALEAPDLSSPDEVLEASEPLALSAASASPVLTLGPSPPPSITPQVRDSSAAPGVLEEALSVLDQLRGDLQGPDRRRASGRLQHILGWLRADASVRAAWDQAVAALEEGQQVVGLAAAARDMAEKDAKAAKEHCHAAEAELKSLRDKQATQARQLEMQEEKLKAREAAVADHDTELEQAAREQATERGCLVKLKEEVEAEKAQLQARKKLLAEAEEAANARHAAFDSLKKRSRKALQDLYGSGLKEPLVTSDEGTTELLLKLVTTLEGVVVGVGPMVEGEARTLCTSAMTRVFSHPHLGDPSFDFSALLEPVDPERYTTAAEAVKDQVQALLRKFLVVDPATTADGAVDPMTTADGKGDDDVIDDGTPLMGDGSVQG